MTTRWLPILNALNTDDTAGLSYEAPLSSVETFTNLTHDIVVPVLADGATDAKWHGKFTVPTGYNTGGTTKAVAVILAKSTGNYDLAFAYIAKANASESIDVAAVETINTTPAAGSGNNFNLDKIEFTLTAANLAPDDEVLYTISRDNDGSDTKTADYALIGLYLEYDQSA